ncbi:MAG: hypothetical protein KDJ75_05250 [Alphaproteobacteria bacterium]|nr:hypothetical protein [Alphaproteobacteria bacterium]
MSTETPVQIGIRTNANTLDPHEILTNGSHQPLPTAKLDTMLRSYGFECQGQHGSSHLLYKHPKHGITVLIVEETDKIDSQKDAARACLKVLELEALENTEEAQVLTEAFAHQNGNGSPRIDLENHQAEGLLIKKYGALFVISKENCPHTGIPVSNTLTEKSLKSIRNKLDEEELSLQSRIHDMAEEYELDIGRGKNGVYTLHQPQYNLSCTLPPYTPFQPDALDTTLSYLSDRVEFIDGLFEEGIDFNDSDALNVQISFNSHAGGSSEINVAVHDARTNINCQDSFEISATGKRLKLDSYFVKIDGLRKRPTTDDNTPNPFAQNSKALQKALAPLGYDVKRPAGRDQLLITHPLLSHREDTLPILGEAPFFMTLWERYKAAEQEGQAGEADNVLLDLLTAHTKYMETSCALPKLLQASRNAIEDNNKRFNNAAHTLKQFGYVPNHNFKKTKTGEDFRIYFTPEKEGIRPFTVEARKISPQAFFIDPKNLDTLCNAVEKGLAELKKREQHVEETHVIQTQHPKNTLQVINIPLTI